MIKFRKYSTINLFWILLFISMIIRCQSYPGIDISTTQTVTDRPSAASTTNPLSTLLGTPLVNNEDAHATITAAPATLVTDPLRFTLPTPGALPVSSWRPALYPVPWALSSLDHFFFTRPVTADEVNWPLPDYRYGNAEFTLGIPHTGVDIVAPAGTEVLATGAGTVVWSGFGLFNGFEDPDDPYGIAVAIQHDFGYEGEPLFTVYAHMSEAIVKRGQRVQLGDVVGFVGETGLTTGPHLHYEVRLGGNTYFNSVNPELWMSPPQGWGVLVGRVMSTGSALLESHEVRITSLETNRRWYVQTYGTIDVINKDKNYRENFVLSGLPAGIYEIYIPYLGSEHRYGVRIYPGAISFFTYRGFNGFSTSKPLGILPKSMPR